MKTTPSDQAAANIASSSPPDRRPWQWLAAGFLLTFMAALLGWTLVHDSVCTDEVAHIAAGLSYAQKLDLRLNPEHPPLVKLLSGIVLSLRGVQPDYFSPFWQLSGSGDFSHLFVAQWAMGNWLLTRWSRPDVVLFWGRLPDFAITLLLALAIFFIARRLGGIWGGLLSLALAVSTPVFLAFGAKVLTDVPIALMALLTLWRLGALWQHPGKRNRLLFALTFAGALLSKYSAALLVPGFIAIWIGMRWLPEGGGGERTRAWRRPRVRAMGRGVLEAFLLVYGIDLLLSLLQPAMEVFFFKPLPHWAIHWWLLPLETNLMGLLSVLMMAHHSAYLFGRNLNHGVWYYYPVLLLLKSTPGFVLTALLAAALGIGRRIRGAPRLIAPELRLHWRALWMGGAIFAALCIISNDDLAFRYFIVPVAILLVLLAPLATAIQRMTPRARITALCITLMLAGSSLLSVLYAAPFFVPYYNVFAAGRPTYYLAGDANDDFNQSTPEVLAFAARHQVRHLPYDYYGITVDMPALYPNLNLWSCQSAPPARTRWVAVSAAMLLQVHNCGWLLRYPHESLGGGAVYAFRLPPVLPPAGMPGGPTAPQNVRHVIPSIPNMREQLIRVMHDPANFGFFSMSPRKTTGK